jgi:hypothetical protein
MRSAPAILAALLLGCAGFLAQACSKPGPGANAPATPSGTWVAHNEDGEFRLDFKPDNTLILTSIAPRGKVIAQLGSFTLEGGLIYVMLANRVPMVLRFVNHSYESAAFGVPMKFVKQ